MHFAFCFLRPRTSSEKIIHSSLCDKKEAISFLNFFIFRLDDKISFLFCLFPRVNNSKASKSSFEILSSLCSYLDFLSLSCEIA